MKKLLSLLLAVVTAATMLTGCGGQSSNSGATGENSTPQTDKKEKVVVACWGNQMLDTYTQYLCDLFPQVEFEFVLPPTPRITTASVRSTTICPIF